MGGGVVCLICGQDLAVGGGENDKTVAEVEGLVKQEVISEEGGEEGQDLGEDQDNFLGKSTRDDKPGREAAEEEGKWTEDDKTAYQWFLTSFKIRVESGKGKRAKGNLGWSADSGNEGVPFCWACRMQILTLIDLQRTVEDLERRLKKGMRDIKGMANSAEAVFLQKGVYEKDWRYGAARKQFLSEFEKGGTRENRRKSTQTKGKPGTHTTLKNGATSAAQPVVLLSVRDKSSAEGHLPSLDIKSDHSSDTLHPQGEDDLQNDTTPASPLKRRLCDSQGERRSTRKKQKRYTFSDDLSEEPGGDCRDEAGVDPGEDDDWREVEVKTKKPSRSSSKKRRPGPAREEALDEDWTMEDDNLEDDPDEEDAAEEEEEFSEEEKPGREKYGRYKLDKEKGIATYKCLEFRLVEPLTEERYQCQQCFAEVERPSYDRIRTHYLKSHSNQFACKLCGARAQNTKTLKIHMHKVHDRRPPKAVSPKPTRYYLCRYCGKPVSRYNKKRHEFTHKNEEERRLALEQKDRCVPWEVKVGNRFQCEICGRKFYSSCTLAKHKEVIHGNDESRESRKELCAECGERFVSLKSHHERVHQNKRQFLCLEPDPNCGKAFKTLAELRHHKNNVHRKIRDFKCPLCPREFSSERALKNHMNLHNGVRPHQCSQCPGIAFTTPAHLRRHQGIYHSGEGKGPKRKAYVRGPTMLNMNMKKDDLVSQGKYLPPSALASWAAGREPTSHFLPGTPSLQQMEKVEEN